MDDEKLPLFTHLEELRRRILYCVIAIMCCSIPCYLLAGPILTFLSRSAGELVFISPHGAFIAHIKLAFFGGIFIAFPVLTWQIWSFIAIGLKRNERKYLSLYGVLSFLFFIIGAVFAYYLVLPIGMKFLLGFATDTLRPMVSVNKYISFVALLLFAFGLVFELPLIILFLTRIGVVTPETLEKNRKYAIVLTFVVAAVLTPPDVLTQILLAVPSLLLFEMSIWLSKLTSRRRREKLDSPIETEPTPTGIEE